MVSLYRVKARWSGFSGAPGYSVLHFRDFGTGEGGGAADGPEGALGAATRVHTFFTAIRSGLPTAVKIDVEPEVDLLESTDGTLVDSYGITAPAQVVGSSSTTFASASGSVVNWRTTGIRNGRRVRGRTFLVPLAAAAQGPDGNMGAAMRTTIETAARALADISGTPDLVVFARPTGPGATDGAVHVVSGVNVPAKMAILSSRRD